MFYIDFNGHKNTDYGLVVTTRPSIPAPLPRGEYVQIAGRDGELLITDNTYANITIQVQLNYVNHPNKLGESFRRAKAWLKGGGKLKMGDDHDVFYRVKASAISEHSRRGYFGSDFVAEFICDPYTYMENGTEPIQPGTIYNPYDTSHPIYKIYGEGTVTLTVNDRTVEANVGQNLTIDTDLFMAYREDGTLSNVSVTGDYNDLWLVNGDNTVSVSGGTLEIIPNWRVL